MAVSRRCPLALGTLGSDGKTEVNCTSSALVRLMRASSAHQQPNHVPRHTPKWPPGSGTITENSGSPDRAAPRCHSVVRAGRPHLIVSILPSALRGIGGFPNVRGERGTHGRVSPPHWKGRAIPTQASRLNAR